MGDLRVLKPKRTGKPRRCTGPTKTGKACGIRPAKGTDRCWRHPHSADAKAGDARGRARDERWSRQAFLVAYGQTLMVSEACRMVGVGRSTVYEERQRNEDFALAWADVDAKTVERLEAEMFRRAHDGVTKMVVSAGKILGEEAQFSDSLLMFALKAKRPDIYRDRVDVAHSGSVEKRVRVDLARLDDDDLAALERMSAKLDAADSPSES